MACDVPSDRGSKQVRSRQDESLQLLATLQVKIDVLRRAQTLAPQLAAELQATIDDIRRELRAIDAES